MQRRHISSEIESPVTTWHLGMFARSASACHPVLQPYCDDASPSGRLNRQGRLVRCVGTHGCLTNLPETRDLGNQNLRDDPSTSRPGSQESQDATAWVRMKDMLGAASRGVLNAPDIAGHKHSEFMLPPHTVNRFTAPHLLCMPAAPAACSHRACSFGLLRLWRPPLRSSRKHTVHAL